MFGHSPPFNPGLFGGGTPTPPAVFGTAVRDYDQLEGAGTEDSGFTYRFTMDFGPESSGRVLIAKVYAGSASAQISSVSIGGSAATVIVKDTSNSSRMLGAFFAMPTGTSGDVVVTLTAAGTRCGVELSSIDNTTQTSYDSRDQSSGTTRTGTAQFLENNPTLTPPTGGLIMAFATHNNTVGTFTWSATTGTGTTHLNQRVGSGPYVSSYDIIQDGANTIRAAHTQTADAMRYLAFTWGP